jgi:hypothetical protein
VNTSNVVLKTANMPEWRKIFEAEDSDLGGGAELRTAEVHLLLEMAVHLLSLKSMLNVCLFNSILNCCFKYVDFYIC